MAKNKRGQIFDISLITPLEEDIKEEDETQGEAYEDEVPIDISLFCGNEAPENSQSVQDDPLLLVPQGSFKDKREFTLQMQKEVGLMVEECVQVLNKNPREYHPFYVTIQKWLEIGLKLFHIPEGRVSLVWEKCDSFACSEFEKYEKNHTLQRKPHNHNPQKETCSSKASQVETVWKKLLSSTTFSKNSLFSLKTRLLFFQYAKTLTSPQECSEMNFLWDRLLSSKLQSAPALKSPDVSGSKDKLSKSVHTMAKNLPELKIIIKKCTPGEKPETDEGQKKLHKSKVNFALGSLLSLKQSSRIPELRDAELHKMSRQEQINDQQQANAERDRFRRLTFTAEQKKANAEKERLRRLNFTTEEKKARIERERLRRLNFTAEQKKAYAEKQRLRRLNFTAEEKKAKVERQRLRRLNFTAEQKKANAEKKRLQRLNFTAEEKKADAEKERLRRLNFTAEEKEARAEKERLRKLKFTAEQKKARAETERLRRLNFTAEQKKARAETERLRRLNFTAEQKEARAEKARLRRQGFTPAQRQAETTKAKKRKAARIAEENMDAFLKRRRYLSKEQMKADFEERSERREAKTGKEKDAYLKMESFRMELRKKELESYQFCSEDELFSEVEIDDGGLLVQENFVFKSKSEFEAELEKAMLKIFQECVQVLQIDPREYHPFYVKLHLFIEAGLEQNFIDASEINSIWERWDFTGVSQFMNKLDNPSTKLSIEEFENNHGPSLHLDLILLKRIPPSTPKRSWSVADREVQYQAVTKGWRDILANEASSIDLRSDLRLRLKLFQSCSSMTFLEDSNRMTNYWGKLFNRGLDQLEDKIKIRLSEIQKKTEEIEERRKQKKWERYMHYQAWKASLTEEQKLEETHRTKMKYAALTKEEKMEKSRKNKEYRESLTGEKKMRLAESVKRANEKTLQKMKKLKQDNFEKWKEIRQKTDSNLAQYYKERARSQTPEQRQKRLAKYKIMAKKTLLKKQVANGVITEEEMEVQFQEAKKRIEEETFSAPPKPYKERPRKKKLMETLSALTPLCLEKVEQPLLNANPPTVLMLPESSTRTVILVDGKEMNQNYVPPAPDLPHHEIQPPRTMELVESPSALEVMEGVIPALKSKSPSRSPLMEGFDDHAAPFDEDCDEFEDIPTLELRNNIAMEIEMDGENEKEVVTGLILTADDNECPVSESFSSPSSPIVESIDGTDTNVDHDLLLNSVPTCESEAKPEVPEQKCAQKKKHRVHKTRPRVKISCPKCGKKINSENLCSHYDRCGTNPETKRKRKPSSAPTAPSTEVLSCPQCSQWFCGKHVLARHQYFAHGDGTNPDNHLRCHLCVKSFRQKATLDDHIRRVHEGKGFYCDLCPKRGDLQSAAKLWKHKVSFHGLEDLPPPAKATVVQCEFCGETVLSKYLLHVKKKHPEMLTHMESNFKRKSNSSSAAGELQKCPECSKSFNTQWLLRHRKKMHGIGESVFCPECNLEFKYKADLQKHVEKKHGIWEKFCQYNLVGKDPSNLNKRVCFLCLETFNAIGNAQIHVIENHKEVYEYLKTGGVEKAGENEEKTFKCIKCLQDFEGGNTLAEHYKEEHNLEKGITKRKRSNRSKNTRSVEKHDYRCEDCGVKFETSEDWIKHRHTKHNEEIEKLDQVVLKLKNVKEENLPKKLKAAKATLKKAPVASKKNKHSLKLRKDVATVRRSLRKIVKRKFINEDSDSDDSGSEGYSKVSRVCVKVEGDSLVQQMKILKVTLVRLTKAEIEQYIFNQ